MTYTTVYTHETLLSEFYHQALFVKVSCKASTVVLYSSIWKLPPVKPILYGQVAKCRGWNDPSETPICKAWFIGSKNYPPEVQHSPWKMMVGRLFSFWDAKFSGAMGYVKLPEGNSMYYTIGQLGAHLVGHAHQHQLGISTYRAVVWWYDPKAKLLACRGGCQWLYWRITICFLYYNMLFYCG